MAFYNDTWVSSKTQRYMNVHIEKGFSIQVSNGTERYIVNVEEVNAEYVIGTIANSPPHAHRVRIPRQCILKVYTDTFTPPEVLNITMMPMMYDMIESDIPTGLIKWFLQRFHPKCAANTQNGDMRVGSDR